MHGSYRSKSKSPARSDGYGLTNRNRWIDVDGYIHIYNIYAAHVTISSLCLIVTYAAVGAR